MYVFQGITLLKMNLHWSEKSFMVLVCFLFLDNIPLFFLSDVYFSALDLSCLKVFSVKLVFLNYGKVLKLILVNLAELFPPLLLLCLLLWDMKRDEELLRRELRALRGAQCSGELPPPAGKGRINEVWSFCMIWSPSKHSSACLLLLPSWDNRGAKVGTTWTPPPWNCSRVSRAECTTVTWWCRRISPLYMFVNPQIVFSIVSFSTVVNKYIVIFAVFF